MWKKNDVIQIDPAHDEMFGGCFMIVTEPKSWGAQGYCQAPGESGQAFYRLKFENGVRIGSAEWIIDTEDE